MALVVEFFPARHVAAQAAIDQQTIGVRAGAVVFLHRDRVTRLSGPVAGNGAW